MQPLGLRVDFPAWTIEIHADFRRRHESSLEPLNKSNFVSVSSGGAPGGSAPNERTRDLLARRLMRGRLFWLGRKLSLDRRD